ncbi:extracellular catalytic domain type 1 short-chain-length polyhydroxyalkanoate depolymerase [Amaricoccus solimangrovi]|uniref:PHB depolymerase family esterase n=1 Tax=Amaricoccus solimangrovi TaxID=2589815 RepID=A0A501WPJ6_9RHOB|nr:PHB depolymerase family esterase [Amaricoccus solimangrovi]TPE48951.1 PHB depolymerase family esterase [Amaricoccus solimangrovi]
MLKLVKRVAARAAKAVIPARTRAAAGSLPAPADDKTRPARARTSPARPKPAKAAPAKPRGGLAEILRWIEAGGMPARPPKARARVSAPRGASFRLATHANDRDKRSYRLYLPAALNTAPAPMPLVVMLHGCGQTPEDFAAGTRMNALAEEFGFLVAYPAQATKANSGRCWNWFLRGDQIRGAGEPALIAGIVRTILRDHPVDPARVYIAGLSAGGSAAHVIAGAYPDLFAAAGVHSGVPAGAAHNAASAFLAMRHGAPGDRPAAAVPTIIFHGAADAVVHPRNGRFVEARTLAVHPRLARVEKTGRTAGGRDYRVTIHRAANGKPRCEHWVIEEAGHAWSGGHPSGSYTDPAGPDASREMLRFFLRHRLTARQRRPPLP